MFTFESDRGSTPGGYRKMSYQKTQETGPAGVQRSETFPRSFKSGIVSQERISTRGEWRAEKTMRARTLGANNTLKRPAREMMAPIAEFVSVINMSFGVRS